MPKIAQLPRRIRKKASRVTREEERVSFQNRDEPQTLPPAGERRKRRTHVVSKPSERRAFEKISREIRIHVPLFKKIQRIREF
jgi:hypothetical protein